MLTVLCVAGLTLLAPPRIAHAQDATLELSEGTLNKLRSRLGTVAASGTYQPTSASVVPGVTGPCELVGFLQCGPSAPGGTATRIPVARCFRLGGGVILLPAGDPLPWSWWVTDAQFAVTPGSMTYTATVHWRVGAYTGSVTRTVPAAIDFDGATDRLRVRVGTFVVDVVAADGTLATRADVGGPSSIEVPVLPQVMTVPMPDGSTRVLDARALGVTPQYRQGSVQVTIDVGF